MLHSLMLLTQCRHHLLTYKFRTKYGAYLVRVQYFPKYIMGGVLEKLFACNLQKIREELY